MNREGKAITLVTREEAPFLTEIEILINRQILPMSFDTYDSLFWPHSPKVLPPAFAPDPAGGEEEENEEGAVRIGRPTRKGRKSGPAKPSSRPRKKASPKTPPQTASETAPLPGGAGDLGEFFASGTAEELEDRKALGGENAWPGAEGGQEVQPLYGQGDSSPGPTAPENGEGPLPGPRAQPKPRRPRGRSGPKAQGTVKTEIVCADCGAAATVPFTPKPGRPVYCDACYAARKNGKKPAAPEKEYPPGAIEKPEA
jgi:CxxC-x17-CxxC domain-containing protein